MRIVGAVSISEEAYFSGHILCPNCGGSKFGSTQQADGALVRSCHGWENSESPCDFKWASTEDHLYFHLPLLYVLQRNSNV